ncbi:MAG: Smr/MutS family protein [Flavobacteriales bacterium]|nr:Smr/MutS family protein [Flavobacteriales bacterium]
MKITIGDKVKAIDEELEGIVVNLLGKSIIVESDGFEFPFRENQLIKMEEPHSQVFNEYNQHAPTPQLEKEFKKKPTATRSHIERIEEIGKVRGKRNSQNVLEFDLHIHDLLVNHRGMASGEMLDYQKEYAVNCIEEALKKGETSIIFIHGIGKGILKSEILKIFREYRFDYHDASLKHYGIGATEVILR